MMHFGNGDKLNWEGKKAKVW